MNIAGFGNLVATTRVSCLVSRGPYTDEWQYVRSYAVLPGEDIRIMPVVILTE